MQIFKKSYVQLFLFCRILKLHDQKSPKTVQRPKQISNGKPMAHQSLNSSAWTAYPAFMSLLDNNYITYYSGENWVWISEVNVMSSNISSLSCTLHPTFVAPGSEKPGVKTSNRKQARYAALSASYGHAGLQSCTEQSYNKRPWPQPWKDCGKFKQRFYCCRSTLYT